MNGGWNIKLEVKRLKLWSSQGQEQAVVVEKTILKQICDWKNTLSEWPADGSCVISMFCDAFF